MLIIGGGILGFSSAYHLKSENPNKRIVVIDKNSASGQGNTSKSEGAFRNVFASQTNYLLADSTINFFQYLQEKKGYDLKMSFIGYLWLFGEKKYNRLVNVFNKMRKMGIELRTMNRQDVKSSITELVTEFDGDEEAELMGLEPIDVGLYAPKCGSVDADSVCRTYESEYLKLGGEISYNTEAKKLHVKPKDELGLPGEPFIWQDKVIRGAWTNKGTINAETTILATGAWAESLLTPAGFDPFMRPKKRQLFVFKDPMLSGLFNVKGLNDEGILPLTILPKSGVYLKGELSEGSVWLGCADDVGRQYSFEEDPSPEEDYYNNNIYHILAKYFPCFTNIRPVNMWAGQYSINSLDMTPVVSSSPGMIYVGAASGSGIMKSDALGRIVAASYAERESVELFGGRSFPVADLGISTRNVEKETFVI